MRRLPLRLLIPPLPGIDPSFLYGSFLGVSANLQVVVFDTIGYHGLDEIQAIVNSLVDELPDKEPGLWTAKVLGEVGDPDPYAFEGIRAALGLGSSAPSL